MPMFSNEEKISVSCFMFILDSLTVYINSSSHLNTILFQSVGEYKRERMRVHLNKIQDIGVQ